MIDLKPRQSQHLDHQTASPSGQSLAVPPSRGSNHRATPCPHSPRWPTPKRGLADCSCRRPIYWIHDDVPLTWQSSRSPLARSACCRRSAGRRAGAPASPCPAEARSVAAFTPSRQSGPSVAAPNLRSGPKPFPAVVCDHRSRRRRASRVPVRSTAPKRAGPSVVGRLASPATSGRPRRASRTEVRSARRLLPLLARPRRPLPRPLPGRSPVTASFVVVAPPGDVPSRSPRGVAPKCAPAPRPFWPAGPATSSTACRPPVRAEALFRGWLAVNAPARHELAVHSRPAAPRCDGLVMVARSSVFRPRQPRRSQPPDRSR